MNKLPTPYACRRLNSWMATRDDIHAFDVDTGYCLDAVCVIPAGSTVNLDPIDAAAISATQRS